MNTTTHIELSQEQRNGMLLKMQQFQKKKIDRLATIEMRRLASSHKRITPHLKPSPLLPYDAVGVIILYLDRVRALCLCDRACFSSFYFKKQYVSAAKTEGYARRSLANHIEAKHPRGTKIATVVHKTYPDPSIVNGLKDAFQKAGARLIT